MSATITLNTHENSSPLTIIGRNNDCAHYAALGYAYLIEATGAKHLVHLYRDVKVLAGSISSLPQVPLT